MRGAAVTQVEGEGAVQEGTVSSLESHFLFLVSFPGKMGVWTSLANPHSQFLSEQ